MGLDVVGAGFGRTGTLSLKQGLERLGFVKCYHMMEVMGHPEHVSLWAAAHRGEAVDWDALFEGYRASVDWPSCNLWRELADYYPEAKVILSTRDPELWYESVRQTIYPSSIALVDSENEVMRGFARWVNEIIWERVFDGRLDDRSHCIRIFRAHEAAVKAAVSPERLLVFDPSEGWEPLCEFLGAPVPDEPFPRVNTTEEFLSRSTVAPE